MKQDLGVREANFDDEGAVKVLCIRNGLAGEQSEFAWNWLWIDNPACKENWPIGWILEANNEVVGYIGNVPRAYQIDGQQVVVGAARSFVVDHNYRGSALKLMANFITKNPAEILIFSGVNNLASPLYRMARASILPQTEYGNSLFWVVSGRGFSSAFLRKKGVIKSLAKLAGVLIGPAFAVEGALRKRWKLNGIAKIEYLQPSEITVEFDSFWNAFVSSKPHCFLAQRDYLSLKWQFGHPAAASRRPVVVCARIKGELKGYAVLTRWDSPEFGLKRIMFTDLIVLDNNEQVIKELVVGSYQYADADGVDLLQLMALPTHVRKVLDVFTPFKKNSIDSTFWYDVKNTSYDLSMPDSWYVSMLDGDSTL